MDPNLDLNPCKLLLVKILYGNVSVNEEVTEVLMKYPPRETLNSITMTEDGGPGEQGTYTQYPLNPLSDEDSNYDPDNPDELYSQEREYQDVSKLGLMLHVWANSNAERDKIVQQIKKLIRLAKRGHYLFCTNYDKDTTKCATTSEPCDAISRSGDIKPCPYMDVTDQDSQYYRNPSNWWVVTGVRKTEFNIVGSIDADQYDIIEPVYHTSMLIDYMIDEYMSESVNPLIDVSSDFSTE